MIGQPSVTLWTAGLQLETLLSRAFDALCDRGKYFQTSPNIHLPTRAGRRKGLGAPMAFVSVWRYSAKLTGSSSQTL